MYRRDDAIILFNITLNPAKILHLSPSSLSIALYPWHTPPPNQLPITIKRLKERHLYSHAVRNGVCSAFRSAD